MNGSREKLGALWKRKSKKDGSEFLAGKVAGQDVVIFPVWERKNERSPDFEVFRSDPRASSGTEESAATNSSQPKANPSQMPAGASKRGSVPIRSGGTGFFHPEPKS